MFTCYLDETETHAPVEPITGVAGFLFHNEDLDSLKAEWLARTARLGEPFHARKHKRYKPLMSDLARIIAKYRRLGFVCTVGNGDFADWAQKSPANQTWLGNPYCLAHSYVLGMVRVHLRQDGLDGDVAYIIEDGAKGKAAGEAFLRRVMAKRRDAFRLRCFEFLPKDHPRAALVSTADHLAWVWQRNYSEAEREEAERDGARRRGDPEKEESGWSEAFRTYFTPSAPPIRHQHFGRGSFSGLALQIALEGLHRD